MMRILTHCFAYEKINGMTGEFDGPSTNDDAVVLIRRGIPASGKDDKDVFWCVVGYFFSKTKKFVHWLSNNC